METLAAYKTSVFPPFEAHQVFTSGHAMTIAAVYWPRRFALPRAEDRLFRVDPWSQILGHCHWQPGGQAGKSTDAPVILIVHGLEGSSDSGYALGIGEKAFRLGFHVIRLNQRNCGGTEALTPTLYNSGMSADYRAVFEALVEEGFREIFFVGYSMGGNLVLKMAGEFGGERPSQLRGVCGVCPSLDLSACADALERWDNYFFEQHFVAGLMGRFQRKRELFPDRYAAVTRKIRTVREFDDAITAPSAGFRDAEDYYEQSSAKNVLGRITVPTLVITAEDDPFVPYVSFLAARVDKFSAIRFEAPLHGGHCAFISRRREERFWAESRVVEFCEGIRAGGNLR